MDMRSGFSKKSPRPEPLWLTVSFGAILAASFYAVEAYGLLLAAFYGVLLGEVYNRSESGKRIQAFLRGQQDSRE